MVKSWLVQDQTVLGKDYSNLLIADSLLKTIWFINAPCYSNEALASPKANVWDSQFLSSKNTRSTNEVSTASRDFKIDEDDLEELDLRWQVAMLTVRVRISFRRQEGTWISKKNDLFHLINQNLSATTVTKGHFAMECRSGRNQGKRSYGDNGRSNAPTNESSSQALVAQDGLGGYDWSNDFEIEPVNYALMAISSSSSLSSFDNEEIDIQEKDKNRSQIDKTEHENGKSMKEKST
ncbi:hypothetical protein Tco_0635773 [Tanacetum coccineum]